MATENETPNTDKIYFFYDDVGWWYYLNGLDGVYGPFKVWVELMDHYETICRADKVMKEHVKDMEDRVIPQIMDDHRKQQVAAARLRIGLPVEKSDVTES